VTASLSRVFFCLCGSAASIMGTYLSTPVTDKNVEAGESPRLAWGVVDMQGWRKSMEDAHVAHTSPDGQLGVFGVFDGHGGPEVARFCQLYLVSVLEQQETWRAQQQQEQEQLQEGEADSDDPTTNPADTQQQQEQRQPSHPRETGVGRALVEAFHALDRMIDDPSRR
jgi:serine/threonine protein phosphatase PrpC